MKYLLSGAWGYGNIGDDAILEATLALIRKLDPNAEIVCTTYDREYTRDAGLKLPAPLLLSMHRVLSGTEGFWFMTEKEHAVGSYLWPRIPQRVYQRFVQPTLQKISIAADQRRTHGGYDAIVAEFKKADVFLMSGGGYFNTWPEQFNARIRELQLAHEAKCKVVLFGQSIGPFTEEQKGVLKKTLWPTDVICVRDPESVFELKELGFDVALAPDLAMWTSRPQHIEKGLVTVCPAEIQKWQEVVLADQISKMVEESGCRVRLMLTRWIDPDVATLKRLERRLCKHGISNVETLYPKTYPTVLAALEGSEWVISRGLHAMILAWRTGSRVFAITKSRKVDGFLQAINSSDNQCQESNWNNLAEIFAQQASLPFTWDSALHQQVAQKIENAFVDAFKKIGVVR